MGMHGNPGAKGKQGMPGGNGIGCCIALTGLQGALPLPPVMVVKQEPLGLEARSNCGSTVQHSRAAARSDKSHHRAYACTGGPQAANGD